MFLPLFSGEG